MGRKSKKGRRPIGGPFTPILHDIQDSVAYKELSGSTAKLYLRMERVARSVSHNLDCNLNDAQFNFTYSEAKRVLGFSEGTTRRCIRQLWEKGFISVIKIGGVTASDKRGRMSSIYQLCGNWKTYGQGWKERTKFEDDPWFVPSEPKKNETGKW